MSLMCLGALGDHVNCDLSNRNCYVEDIYNYSLTQLLFSSFKIWLRSSHKIQNALL